ncbi:MAG: RES family NAD+ phosphorylase [Acidobacteria bacterium]|nr:RES family NAD+ phosphorylase [Acidobacteriota bacterium]
MRRHCVLRGGRTAGWGRWTPAGRPVVHTSGSVALAVLETLVHAKVNSIPSHRVIAVDIPDSVAVDAVDIAKLPAEWRRVPPPPALRRIGRAWLEAGRAAVLKAPSAIVPVEHNYLLNPVHPDFRSLRVHESERFEIDKRLLQPTP